MSTYEPRDWVERDYLEEIAYAAGRGDTCLAWELSIGFRQYRDLYQDPELRGTPRVTASRGAGPR